MHVTELAINKTLGMRLAGPNDPHLLELPESPLLLNHVGSIHAAVEFALAEACSAEFLLRQLGDAQKDVFAVVRTAEVKFRKAAHGELRASAHFSGDEAASLSDELNSRGRALVSVKVELSDAQGVITMAGRYDWFLQRQAKTD